MVQYTVTVTDEQDVILRGIAASEGYADAQTFVQIKAVEILGGLVKEADAKLRASVAAAMDDPVKAAAIKAAAGL